MFSLSPDNTSAVLYPGVQLRNEAPCAAYYFSIKDVEKIAIEKGVILVYTPSNEESAESLGEKVFYLCCPTVRQGTDVRTQHTQYNNRDIYAAGN